MPWDVISDLRRDLVGERADTFGGNGHQAASALRKASLIHVCHPGPVARNFSRMSASNRSVTCYLASAPWGGRPGMGMV